MTRASKKTPTAAPLISIVINCYNGATYLAQTLESVLAQTFDDWELVFWDNQSSDETAKIFKRYKDSRFRYFLADEHLHLAAAKKLAIDKACGKWIALLDADDLWMPDKLSKQATIISDADDTLGLVYGKMRPLVEPQARHTSLAKRAVGRQAEREATRLPDGEVFAPLLKENFIPQPSVLIRKDLYDAAGGVDESLKHSWDYDLVLKIAAISKTRALQDVCCLYRIHANNLSQTQGDLSFDESLVIVSKYLPDPQAMAGLKSINAAYAAHEIRTGRWPQAIRRITDARIAWNFGARALRFVCARALR